MWKSRQRLMALPSAKNKRKFGGAKGIVSYIADDFDSPVADFAEYVPWVNKIF